MHPYLFYKRLGNVCVYNYEVFTDAVFVDTVL